MHTSVAVNPSWTAEEALSLTQMKAEMFLPSTLHFPRTQGTGSYFLINVLQNIYVLKI